MLDPIGEPLRDRMEIIELQGYTEEEKVHIAFQYLIPRQIEENGITEDQIEFRKRRFASSFATTRGKQACATWNAPSAPSAASRRGASPKARPDNLVVTPEVVQRRLLGGIKIRMEGEIAERTKRRAWPSGWRGRRPAATFSSSRPDQMKGKGGFHMTGQIGRDARIDAGGVELGPVQRQGTWHRRRLFRQSRYPHSRAGGGDPEGWAFGGCDHGDRAGFAAHGPPGTSAEP